METIIPDMKKEWLSAHIFFNGNIYGNECDKILIKVVEPFIRLCKSKGVIEKFFFIRYSEAGSHVRLRLFGDSVMLKSIVKPMLEDFIKNLKENENPDIQNTVNEKESDKVLRWIQYDPEVERYGGENAIITAEDFFSFSSETVIEIFMKEKSMQTSTRLAKGLISIITMLHAFIRNMEKSSAFMMSYNMGYLTNITGDEGVIKQFNESFRTGYAMQSESLLRIISGIWEALEEGVELQSPWNNYYKNLQRIKSDLKTLHENSLIKKINAGSFDDSIKYLIPSYIHMMNNRLGIRIVDEAYLAYLISYCFSNKNQQVNSDK